VSLALESLGESLESRGKSLESLVPLESLLSNESFVSLISLESLDNSRGEYFKSLGKSLDDSLGPSLDKNESRYPGSDNDSL